MNKKHFVNLLKILLAAALVAFVLSKVEWVDSYQHISLVQENGETAPREVVEETIHGQIRGDWKGADLKAVDFQRDDGQPLHPALVAIGSFGKSSADGGTLFRLRGGLPTFVRSMDIWLFLLASLCFPIVVLIAAARWHWLLRINELQVSYPEAFRLSWIGIFFNNVVPGLTGGDVVKAFYVARLTGKKTRPILTVLIDRIMGLVALAVLSAIVILFKLGDPIFRWIALGIWGGLFVLVLGTSFFLSRRLRKRFRLDNILRKLPGSEVLMQIDESIRFYRDHLKGVFFWMAVSVFTHMVLVTGVYLVGLALGLPCGPLIYLILVPIINIVSAVPLAPAGWGVGEALYGFLFGTYASALTGRAFDLGMATMAIALSIVYRIQIMLWSLVGAVFLAFQKGKASSEELAHLMDDLGSDEKASATAAGRPEPGEDPAAS